MQNFKNEGDIQWPKSLRGAAYRHRIEQYVADRAADVAAFLLGLAGQRAYRYMLRALRQRQPASFDFDIQLYAPDYVEPDPAERALVERIFAAYGKAKRDQADHSAVFLPQGGWKNVTDSAYSSLIDGFENGDIDQFHFFLANFGTWRKNTGITQSQTLRRLHASKRKKIHFEQRVMARMVSWWQQSESNARGLSALTIPGFGNQCGALVDGHLIAPYSIFTEIHARLLTGFIDPPQPVLAEVGGGFGRLIYFISRNVPAFTYVGFDLPECLCCACYYLMKTFPDKRFLLYGEGDLAAESIAEYDFLLLPSFEITNLPDSSVDLFINENSLGMTSATTCTLLVREICRTAHAFWHRNHEFRRNLFEDGTASLVNREYPVAREFSEVARYCDISRFIDMETPPSANDMFWYLYRRTNSGRLASEACSTACPPEMSVCDHDQDCSIC